MIRTLKNIIDKLVVFLERTIADPLVGFYLKNKRADRVYTRNGERVFVVGSQSLELFRAKDTFQHIITATHTDYAYKDEFEKAFTRGMQNDPYQGHAE